MTGITSTAVATTTTRAPRTAPTALPDGLFTLGVASGDPLPDGVVLWTRLAPDPLNGGGMPDRDIDVRWEISADPRFRLPVRRGTTTARPAFGHAVHVDVRGLEADAEYWYRFRVGRELSPVGRTRTAPKPSTSGGHLQLALAPGRSDGCVTPWLDLASRAPDAVLTVAAGPRNPDGAGEPLDLAGHRNRYARDRSDPGLRAAHAAAPWIVSFDDAAAGVPRTGSASAAHRAYYEHLPVRAGAVPDGPHIRMYRSFDFGRPVRLHVLDTRRTDPDRTAIGPAQERWLAESLRSSGARWNLIAAQTGFTRTGQLRDVLDGARNPLILDGSDEDLAAHRGYTLLDIRKDTVRATVVLG